MSTSDDVSHESIVVTINDGVETSERSMDAGDKGLSSFAGGYTCVSVVGSGGYGVIT